MAAIYPLTLFYDAHCPVCSLEMDHLRERDDGAMLVFVDISAPGFDPASAPASLDDMNAEIHGLRADGQLIRGVEVLRLAYAAVGLGWVLRPTGWAPVRPLFDAAYRLFARHRMLISRHAAPLINGMRARRMAAACSTGACHGPARR